MSKVTYDTLVGMIVKHGTLYSDKLAFQFEGAEITYAGLDALSNRIGHALIASGIEHGDHISYLGKNSLTYYAILMGAAKAGAVLTPINWRLARPEITYILNDAKAKLLFVGQEFIETASALKPTLESCKTFITYETSEADFVDFQDWIAPHSEDLPDLAISEDDILVQLYTSGTTGHPKGVMLPHRSLIGLKRIADDHDIEWSKWGDDDVSLVGMPCFHIGGTGWGLAGLMSGAKGVITREFFAHEVLDYIETYKISKIFLVPAAMQLVVNHPRAREVDYSTIQYMLYGASPIPLDLLRTCMEVFKCGFVQMYGMTETSGTVVTLPPEDHDPNGNEKMRSAGKASPGVEIAIMDSDGNFLPSGETGQIVTRSPANMAGYWNLPDETVKTLRPDGWLCTGDAGMMDEDGYIYIHDRVKDMIISGGENVYPAEVENALFSHPDVADVGVIGVPDQKWGEVVKAMVVLKANASSTEDDIIAYTRTQIAAFKCPKSIDFIDELPRNPSGKILRRILRKPFWEGKERAVN